MPANVQRSEIKALRERRVELYQKAAAAFKKKSGGEAAYYSEEGRKLTDKIHGMEADFRFRVVIQFSTVKPLKSILNQWSVFPRCFISLYARISLCRRSPGL